MYALIYLQNIMTQNNLIELPGKHKKSILPIRHPVFAAAFLFLCLFLTLDFVNASGTDEPEFELSPLVRTVDLNIGESATVELHDGSVAEVQLLDVEPVKDSVMDAVRKVYVTVLVNGEEKTLTSASYQVPVTMAGVQIDSPVTLDYMESSNIDWWGLEKDARLRLWPEGSPLIWPGTLVYPVDQKWFASSKTQYSNEPVRGSPRADGSIYYHAGIDFGGYEDKVEVFAATDGVIVSVAGEVLEGEPEGNPINERYEVIYIRDDRGWYYRYSHFDSILPDLEVGQRVMAGDKLGMLGKEGASGGWAHLHFHIESKQPSGEWGVQDSYAFLMEAYKRQFDPDILPVARPYQAVFTGEPVTISGAESWAKYEIETFEWTLSDGSSENGVEIERTYEEPGMYSEILKVTDVHGNYGYDTATVMVFEEEYEENRPPRIHAAYYPTRDIQPGDKVYFKVRSTAEKGDGYDVWDFDDGSDPVAVLSNTDSHSHAKIGYAIVTHRFEEPGDYLVKVERETSNGTATAHVHVQVQPSSR
jgi:murein DD-endopeptidase MepM/ murein hydrolase activator NlpD